MSKDTRNFAFEQSLNEIERLLQKMEAGDMSLDESMQAFERGIQLTRDCQKALTEAEQKIQKLVEQKGELITEPFEDLDVEE